MASRALRSDKSSPDRAGPLDQPIRRRNADAVPLSDPTNERKVDASQPHGQVVDLRVNSAPSLGPLTFLSTMLGPAAFGGNAAGWSALPGGILRHVNALQRGSRAATRETESTVLHECALCSEEKSSSHFPDHAPSKRCGRPNNLCKECFWTWSHICVDTGKTVVTRVHEGGTVVMGLYCPLRQSCAGVIEAEDVERLAEAVCLKG